MRFGQTRNDAIPDNSYNARGGGRIDALCGIKLKSPSYLADNSRPALVPRMKYGLVICNRLSGVCFFAATDAAEPGYSN